MYIKTKKAKRFLCCLSVILLLFTLFSGCGAQASAKTRAEEIAVKVLTCTAEQRDSFGVTILGLEVTDAGIRSTKSFAKVLENEYGDYLTDECIEKAAENRYFLFGSSALKDIDGDITPKELKLTKSPSTDNAFDYTAELYVGGTRAATASGTITLSADETTKASSFTVKLVK